jgi:hyperosmotically inducible protein
LAFLWDFLANGVYTRFVFPAMRKLLLLIIVGGAALGAYNYSVGRDILSLPGMSAGTITDAVRDTVRDTVRDGVKSAARETRDEVKERAIVARQHAKETAREAAQRAEDAVSAAALTSKIKAKMALDDGVTASNINVDTDEGVVTLTGTVESKDEQRRAVRIATETSGVTRVVNRLEVR